MNPRSVIRPDHSAEGQPFRAESALRPAAFTLLELLIVIGIIGLMLSIGIPAMKGIGQTNLIAAGNRQVLDELAYARLRAIRDRATVYMVFVPTNLLQYATLPLIPAERAQWTNLVSAAYAGYAFYSDRTVGDQPGQHTPRYLGPWRTLPKGMLFTPYQFNAAKQNAIDPAQRAFRVGEFPFPDINGPRVSLPYIAFDSSGQLLSRRDEVVSLSQGSVMVMRNNLGQLLPQPPDVMLTPPDANNARRLYISWITGRAKALTQ